MKPTSLKCLIADDETIAAEGIANYIAKTGFLLTSAVCTSAAEAADVLGNEKIDLMFLDINMPDVSGIELLQTLDNPPMAILTTAYSEYALKGYELNIIDYLLKPVGFDRFLKAVLKARHIYTLRQQLQTPDNQPESAMYVRQNDCFKKIHWKDILYAEGMQNYVKLHFRDKTLVIHQTMTSLEKMLPENSFFRTHRSFLVNMQYIDTLAGNRIFICGRQLPVSARKMKELLKSVIYKNLLSK